MPDSFLNGRNVADSTENHANGKEDARYKPYILKRLTDFDPYLKKEVFLSTINIKQVKEDVFDNIEMLFNSSSHPSLEELKGYTELENSVMGYGISDYCGKVYSGYDREELRAQIIKQLKDFEPRLAPDSISVDFANTNESTSHMEFNISGLIQVGPVSEEVLFVSKLDFETGNAELESLKD
jgi:type VI secretion system lysozyme-like protein